MNRRMMPVTLRLPLKSVAGRNAPIETNPMAAIPGWLFYKNKKSIPVWASLQTAPWLQELEKKGVYHRLSLNDVDNHYVWQGAYNCPELRDWLLSQPKSGMDTKPTQLGYDQAS